jgi:glycerate kinase
VRVLVAPDKFKGTLSAAEAASAIARGWRRADAKAEIEAVPLADGGEGTLDALVTALGGELRSARVTGPVGGAVDAPFGLLPGSPRVGVVEMARASGLALVPADRRDPTRTTTRGTGELLLAAIEAGAGKLLVGVGGSGTNDAGAGMAQALGVRFLDRHGHDLAPGGAPLLELDRIEMSGPADAVRGVAVEVLTDVDNPLVGPDGASAVFGPQKGATAADVALLDRALTRFAVIVARDIGVEVASLPGSGAAGGTAAGLVAFRGARIRPGLGVVMEATDFRGRAARADTVVTGEGAFDGESLRGKVVGGVIREARKAGARRVIVLCGRADGAAPAGVEVVALTDRFGPDRAMRAGAALLEDLAADAASAAGRVST